MKYFDMSELTAERMAALEQADPAVLNAPLDPDPAKGMQKVADLLTFLPEESRLAAVNGFLIGMLSTSS